MPAPMSTAMPVGSNSETAASRRDASGRWLKSKERRRRAALPREIAHNETSSESNIKAIWVNVSDRLSRTYQRGTNMNSSSSMPSSRKGTFSRLSRQSSRFSICRVVMLRLLFTGAHASSRARQQDVGGMIAWRRLLTRLSLPTTVPPTSCWRAREDACAPSKTLLTGRRLHLPAPPGRRCRSMICRFGRPCS